MQHDRDVVQDSHLSGLTTEAVSTQRQDLDTWSTDRLVKGMSVEDAQVPLAVSRELDAISVAIDAIVERMARGGRLIYVGAGTPGRIGVLDASEAPPTFGTAPGDILAIIAGGDRAVFSAVENAEDDLPSGRRDIAAHTLSDLDCVVGVSASGRTPYVLGALAEAREKGALTVALACNRGSDLGRIAEHRIEVVVGPEFVSGSTRLKAGTAQKLVLNMISTIAMIKLGKTYGSLMIALRATNDKLRARAETTVMTIADVAADEARTALEGSAYDVRTAALMLAAGTSAPGAERLLAEHHGRFRDALESTRRS